MEILEKFNQAFEEFESKKKQLVEDIRPQFKDLFSSIFDSSEVESFVFSQYTPYFNDGDECIFGVHDCYTLKIKGQDEFVDGYSDKKYSLVLKDINKILFSIPEQIMKDLFGDHVEVTVKKDEIITENCEHD